MLKGTPLIEFIKTLSEIFNITSEERKICGDIKDLKTSKEAIKFSSLGYMRQINDEHIIKCLARKLGICNGYKVQNIAELLPELSPEEIATSNLFVAMMQQGDDAQVVLIQKVS